MDISAEIMTELTLYNSLKRKKQPFKPMNVDRVTMYNCGPTVYSYAHIGNARAAVVADVLFRVLRHIYREDHVVYARNLTDVDDKIIAAAKKSGKPMQEITEKFAKIYQDDLAALNCLPPTSEPKATEHIGGMIALIETLLADGYAYARDGHVFFEVSKYDAYGKLSGNTLDALDNLKKGDRVGEGEVARKKNPADFVLWKPELDGVGWDAPFGRGRPGWHIECSAMAKSELGETIDIHCGGVDLKFPHHENEIAQSNCAHGQPMANYWVHNEFLNMGKDKMSKSLGNVVLVHDLLKEWDGEVIRLALLKAHYRSELIWSENLLKESKEQLDGWYRVLLDTTHIPQDEHCKPLIEFSADILEDINTPEYLSMLNLYGGRVRISYDCALEDFGEQSQEISGATRSAIQARTNFIAMADLLGLLQKDPEEWFRGGLDYDGLVAEYDTVREQALAAKQSGDKAQMGKLFKRSDEIRDQFKDKGVVIESGADGKSKWRKL